MKFHFVPMNAEYVHKITENWHYDGEYRFYDYASSQFIRDPQYWGSAIFAVLDETEELVGEFTIWFEDECMWIGFGLKPELTGCGLGQGFVSAGIRFAVDHHAYLGEHVKLSVAAFNQRAITVYHRLGFAEMERHIHQIDGQDYEFLTMQTLNPVHSHTQTP
jgi:[ribosomal protein S18]-alanine N-acetyltransferase